MALVTVKSTVITNRDASPSVLSNSRISKAQLFETIGTLETSAADNIASKYILCSIPSNARVADVFLSCDALGGTSAADVGLYQTTVNGGAVVDADFFASAVSLVSALTKSNVTHESGVYGIEDAEQPVWQALGLSLDPRIDYDVVVTVTTATTNAGTVTLQIQYAV